MIMKILPLTVHTQHKIGLVGGSDTLSLVAPNKNNLSALKRSNIVRL